MAAPTLAPCISTEFQQVNDLAAASQILCHAQMQAAFGPRRVHDLLANARHYIQKQIDELTSPIFEDEDAKFATTHGMSRADWDRGLSLHLHGDLQ